MAERQLPKLEELQRVGLSAKRLIFSVKIDVAKGFLLLDVDTKGFTPGNVRVVAVHHVGAKSLQVPLPSRLVPAMRKLAKHCDAPRVVVDSVKIRASGSALKGKALRELVTQALLEVFGHAAAKPLRSGYPSLDLLRSGRNGIGKWNRARLKDRQKGVHAAKGPRGVRVLGDFRRSNLAGLDLAGVHLHHLDFSGSSFRGSVLRGARLGDCDLKHADFDGADVTECYMSAAKLHSATLRKADLTDAVLHGEAALRGADLTGARMTRTDLRDSDLSGANLSAVKGLETCLVGAYTRHVGTRYDGKTVFPKGFRPGEGWVRRRGK